MLSRSNIAVLDEEPRAAKLAESRNRLDAEVARLRRLDRDYREQMRTHLTSLLDQVGEPHSEDG